MGRIYMQGPCRPREDSLPEKALTDPLEVSTDHPICRPRPPKVSKNRNQLLLVSSTCCSPNQSSSSSSGDKASLRSGSTSEDILWGIMVGEFSWMNSTWVWPSVSGRPPMSESRPKETSLGRGRGRVEVSILEGGEERGDDEGESPPSGREDDMLAQVAVATGVVLAVGCGCDVVQPWWLTGSL